VDLKRQQELEKWLINKEYQRIEESKNKL